MPPGSLASRYMVPVKDDWVKRMTSKRPVDSVDSLSKRRSGPVSFSATIHGSASSVAGSVAANDQSLRETWIVKALNGHTMHKASLLRAARLERKPAPISPEHRYQAIIPASILEAADKIFAIANEVTHDARSYLKPPPPLSTKLGWQRASFKGRKVSRPVGTTMQRPIATTAP